MENLDGVIADENKINDLIQNRIEAVHNKKLSQEQLHPDILTFDVINPLKYKGKEDVVTRTLEWFSSFDGPIGHEILDLKIYVSGNVAFSHYLSHFSGKQNGGTKIDMWVRTTLGFSKTGDTWTIIHEHSSVPFDPKTGKASMNLKP